MNERIRELAVEAGIISAEYNGFDPTGLTKAQRKFAELIVKECALMAFHNVVNLSSIADAEDVEANIKEHFGVE